MTNPRSGVSLLVALAAGALLAGCGGGGSSSNTTVPTTTSSVPFTQQFVFLPTASTISAVPVTGGLFGTDVQSATATGGSASALATTNGSSTLYSSEGTDNVEVYGISSTGSLATVGADSGIFADTLEVAGALALSPNGGVLYVAGNDGDIEALSASPSALAALVPTAPGGLSVTNTAFATVTALVTTMQVVTVDNINVLLVGETPANGTPQLQAFVLNSDGSFQGGSATSTMDFANGTTVTGLSAFTLANNTLGVVFCTNGTTNNLAAATLDSSGALAPVAVTSPENNQANSAGAEQLSGVYVNGSVAFALGASAGDVQTIGINSDGSLSTNLAVASSVQVGVPLPAGIIPDGVDFFVPGSSLYLVNAATAVPSDTALGTALTATGYGVQSTITFQ